MQCCSQGVLFYSILFYYSFTVSSTEVFISREVIIVVWQVTVKEGVDHADQCNGFSVRIMSGQVTSKVTSPSDTSLVPSNVNATEETLCVASSEAF